MGSSSHQKIPRPPPRVYQAGISGLAMYGAVFAAGIALGFFGKSSQAPITVRQRPSTKSSKLPESFYAEWLYPEPSQLIHKPSYTALVNYKTRSPYWVLEHLTPESLKGHASRAKSEFQCDHEIPQEFRAQVSDYRGSGFSRGHLAPAANHKQSQGDMDSTFMLGTNIVPQNQEHNAGYWARLEHWARNLIRDRGYRDVFVLTGPVYYNPGQELRIQTVGRNQVHVPTHMFKAVLADSKFFAAFVIPNEASVEATDLPLMTYQIDKLTLERMVGFKVFDKFEKGGGLLDLCATGACGILTSKEWQTWIGKKQKVGR